jgi:RHS repeat-associated protein
MLMKKCGIFWTDENLSGEYILGVTWTLTYNAENRLHTMANADVSIVATFIYDADGNKVAQINNGVPTYYFMGGSYEVTGEAVRKYYALAGGMVAMRDADGLKYLLTDHLGSVVAVTDEDGALLEQQRYLPFGGVRTDLATPPYRIAATDHTYTGQQAMPSLELSDYKARFYDGSIGRFLQPDTDVPASQGGQGLDRYAFVFNNPLRYTDPSGHTPVCILGGSNGGCLVWAGLTGANAVAGYEEFANDVDANLDLISHQRGRKEGLKYLATAKGIHLAPGDDWAYAENIFIGGQPVYGWTPSQADEPYSDQSGSTQYASDASVYVTGQGFDACGIDANCVAGLMAHEATHSWIELKIEQSSTTGQPRIISQYTIAEEMLADLVAFRMGDPQGLLTQHYYRNAGLCESQFGSPCFPLTMLQGFYGIDLSNISQLIYGR